MKFFFHNHKTYEWAFKTAGFSHFEWRKFRIFNISPQEEEYYKDLADDFYTIGIVAW